MEGRGVRVTRHLRARQRSHISECAEARRVGCTMGDLALGSISLEMHHLPIGTPVADGERETEREKTWKCMEGVGAF